MMLRVLPALCLIALSTITFAQTAWELTKNKNGIKVYTAGNTSSKFKIIKVEAVLQGTIEKLVTILKDVENNKKWVYNTKLSYLIKKISADEIVYYAETSLPWPVNNRDMAIRLHFTHDTSNHSLRVVSTGVPDAVPYKKDLVRIPHFHGLWDVKSSLDNRIVINYTLTMEPGGSIPAGVTNLFVSKGPYETFNNLAALLKR